MCILHNRDANKFTAGDSFIGYQADTPASIVFKVFQEVEISDDKQWKEKVATCSSS